MIALFGTASLTMLASGVQAADLAVYEPLPEAPVAADYYWRGIYAGLHVGYGWGDRDWDEDGGGFDDEFQYDLDGGLAGAQIGYNWQMNSIVLGIEADAAWANIKDTVNELGGLITAEAEMKWLATVRGRVGYAFDRIMIYGTGGAAFAGVETTVDAFFGGDTASATHMGWAAGLGVEAFVTENISMKVEYLHAGFDDQDFDYSIFGSIEGHADLDVDTVKIGVNYHF